MAAPRLRNKLATAAATRRASEEEEQDKVKGRKAKAKGKAEGDETEEEASEEEDETTAEGEDEEPEASEDEDETGAEGDETEEEASEEEDEPQPAGKKAKKASAAATERARIQAITGSASAKRLPTLANHLAFETAMSAKAAGKLLGVALKDVEAAASGGGKAEAVTPRGGAFRRAMQSEAPNPSLGTGNANSGEPERLMSIHEIRAAKAAAKN